MHIINYSILCSFCFLFFHSSTQALNPQSYPRTVMVQLFEWPWKDVATECENFLGPNGFSAVHVSPPTEHLVWENSPWWERYQPISYQIASRSGTETEFRDMIQRCKRSGVDIYVDVVLNHMAGIEQGTGQVGSSFSHYQYPGLYNFQDFHHCGRNGDDNIHDYNNLWEVQNCELVNLADLATESEKVRNTLAGYLNHLIDLGVSGLRVDAAKHIPWYDLKSIFSRLKKPIYIFQELIGGDGIDQNRYIDNGDITAVAYSFDLGRAFRNRTFYHLPNIGSNYGIASENAIVYVDDHDLQRSPQSYNEILTYKNGELYRLANLFMLAWPYGYPRVFSGYKFDSFDDGPKVDNQRMTKPILYGKKKNNCSSDWVCEHRWSGIAAMAQFRNVTSEAFYITNWWSNNIDQLAFGRGSLGFIAINASSSKMYQLIQTNMPSGKYCNILDRAFDNIRQTCEANNSIDVDGSGRIFINLNSMSALAIHHEAKPH